MAYIRPCADLRNKYNEISKICHETCEPIYITKNGSNDLVVLSNEAYEAMNTELNEKKIEELVAKHFEKRFSSIEDFQKDIIEHLKKAEKEIAEGKTIPAEIFFREMEEKYGFDS